MKVVIFSYQAHKYYEVYLVTGEEETQFIGFTHVDDWALYAYPDYILSNISSTRLCSTYCTLNPFLRGKLQKERRF